MVTELVTERRIMTAADEDQAESGPGFALPHTVQPLPLPGDTDGAGAGATAGAGDTAGATDDAAALTPLQEAVVQDIAQGQHELKSADRFDRPLRLYPDGIGLAGGGMLGALGRAVGAEKMQRVSDSDDEALFLAQQAGDADPVSLRHVVPDGGPPTAEEVHEAEMNPWPHHNMAETIEHNRQMRVGSSESAEATDGSAGGDSDGDSAN
jgi:hypothetical protein